MRWAAKAFLSLASLAVVGWGAVAGVRWLASESAFPVRRLEVVGDVQGTSLEEVQQDVRRTARGSFFSMRLAGVAREVGAISWVKSVKVARLWPDRLMIAVEGYQPAAVWSGGGFISPEGAFFRNHDISMDVISTLPIISGDATYAAEGVGYIKDFSRVAAKLGARVNELHATYRGSWKLGLEGADFGYLTIELGRGADASPVTRLQQVVDNYKHIVDEMTVPPDRIDARYTDAFAVSIPRAIIEKAEEEAAAKAAAKAARKQAKPRQKEPT